MLPALLQGPRERGPRLPLSQSAAATILLQSGAAMSYLKEKWTEEEVLALPDGEHNFFDRKSGLLWNDKGKLYATLAKAISALANSGGGHMVLGQADDGTIDGVPEKEGRTPVREWLEQKVPNLITYPLENFRVHAAAPSSPTRIPMGRALVVIDVGDSRLAPHQTAFPSDAPQYYYRQGGKSVAAPHHYLEALRNRLTCVVLESRVTSVEVSSFTTWSAWGGVLEVQLNFEVKNTSRVACHNWTVYAEVRPTTDELPEPYILNPGTCPPLKYPEFVIHNNRPILQTRSRNGFLTFGFRLNPRWSVAVLVGSILLKCEIRHYAISENAKGPERVTRLEEVADGNELLFQTRNTLKSAGGEWANL